MASCAVLPACIPESPAGIHGVDSPIYTHKFQLAHEHVQGQCLVTQR
jgi:hypothetical protein